MKLKTILNSQKFSLSSIVLASYLFLIVGCEPIPKEALVQNYGPAQGSSYHISYLAEHGVDYRVQIDSILYVIDQSMSLWDERSTISKLNRGDTLELDYHFKKVFKQAQIISAETNGYFDISVAPLASFWGFGPEEKASIDSTDVDSIKSLVGYKKIKYLLDSNFLPKGMQIDMNAIAQGYTVDVISEFLEDKEIANYLVEVGGELRSRGRTVDDRIWSVGIDKPSESLDTGNRFQVIVKLDSAALATSGNYRKFWVDEESGAKYVHTINPLTGFPARTRLLSATIVAASAIEADAWATACMVVGFEKAKELISSKSNLKAYFVYSDLKGNWGTWQTLNFEEIIR